MQTFPKPQYPDSLPVAGNGHLNRLLKLLVPPHCVLCALPSSSICICSGCRRDLPWTDWHCRQCSLPLENSVDIVCSQCLREPPPFTRTISPFQYDFPVDKLVQSLKFNRQLAEGRVLSHLMCEYVCQQLVDIPMALVPVPLHRMRMIRRGYNQSYELAAYAGKLLNIPLQISGLRRHRHTAAQSALNRKQRLKNVRGAFRWQGRHPPPPHIALIDDVMTTATTVTECARVLKQAGADRVDVWVAARALPPGSE